MLNQSSLPYLFSMNAMDYSFRNYFTSFLFKSILSVPFFQNNPRTLEILQNASCYIETWNIKKEKVLRKLGEHGAFWGERIKTKVQSASWQLADES